MTQSPDDPARLNTDPRHLPPGEVLQDLAMALRGALPPPAEDTPEGWARRDRAAMQTVASLQPANAIEGRLAVQFVVADAQASDCLRLVRAQPQEAEAALQCMAQATKLMRESKNSLGLLLRMQAKRRATAKDAAAANRAAWTKYNALEMRQATLPAAPAAGKKQEPVLGLVPGNTESAVKTPSETTTRPRPALAWSDFGEPGSAVH